MKTSCATFAVVLVALCFTSSALAETPVATSTPTPLGVPQIAVPNRVPTFSSVLDDVFQAPEIMMSELSRNQCVDEGQPVEFCCYCWGSPDPAIIAYFNMKQINPFGDKYRFKYLDGTYIFSIKNVKPEDSGSYTFEAINQSGSAQVTTLLTVN